MDKDKKTAASAEKKAKPAAKATKAKKTTTAKKTTSPKKPGRPKKTLAATAAKSSEKKSTTTAKKTPKKSTTAKKSTTTKATKTTKAKTAAPRKTKTTATKAAAPKTAKKTTATKKTTAATKAKPAAKTKTKAVKTPKKSTPRTKKTTVSETEETANKPVVAEKKPVASKSKQPVKPKKAAVPRQTKSKEEKIKDSDIIVEKVDASSEKTPEAIKSKPRQKTAQKTKPTTTKSQSSTKTETPKVPKEQPKKPAKPPVKESSRKLLINAEEPEECRIALLENGKLDAFYVESVSRERTKGNIYKGKIVSIETNLQAAFVDIGTGKNAFLPFSEIHPEYYSKELPSDLHWKDVNFRERLKIGQEILLEVVKETTGNKGANMTSFLSLPGRYVVLMPGSDSHGISRQIDSQEQRRKLREMLDSCNLPEGVGYIIRTASKGITKTALTKDVQFLIKLWNDIRERGQSTPAPALIYGEQKIVTRFLRDHYASDIHEIMVDSQDAFAQVKSFIDLLPAVQKKATTAKLHKGPRPLLNSHNIEEQIEQIYRPSVKLPSGGSIVIDPTEALVAIDVNSGSTGKDKNFAETIFTANMEAAEELARQLRLRDLGGLIVVDFIDMRSAANIRAVEKKVKDSMKRDKAKVDFARISKFGLMQISRQRMGAPISARNYVTCACCKGRGVIRSVETQALAYLRQIQTGCTRKGIKTIRCNLPLEVSQYLLNKKRSELSEMERRYKVNILVEIDGNLKPGDANIEFVKS